MADLLASGPDPVGPRPRRRWVRPLGAVLTAAVAIVALRSIDDDDPPFPPDPVSVLVPAPTPARTGDPPERAAFTLTGVPGRGPAGLRLLVGGRHPGVLDTGTGRLTLLGGLLERPQDEVSYAGGPVVLVGNPERLRSRVLLLSGGRPVELGPTLDALPLRDGTVLTQDCDGGGGTGPCTLTARNAAGRVRWQRTVGRRQELIRDTPAGLLVRSYQGDLGGVVRLEDARTGAVRRVVGRTYDVLAATDTRVLFRPAGCDSNCRLRLADLDGPLWRELPLGAGRAGTAAIAPSGDVVAVAYTGLSTGDPSPAGVRSGYVTVVDVTAARATDVPGLSTAVGSTPLPVWAPDGRLVIAVSDQGTGFVATWRPGERRVTVLPTRLEGLWGVPGMVGRAG